jgi:hypothetical protein
MAGSCEYGDKPAGSGATELVRPNFLRVTVSIFFNILISVAAMCTRFTPFIYYLLLKKRYDQ